MKKFSQNKRRWLVSLHILFVVALLGHVIDMFVLLLHSSSATTTGALQANYMNIGWLGFPIGPISALGTALTGVLLSTYTNWGFFKHPWIIIKIILTPIVIIIGMHGIMKWVSQASEIITVEGMKALQDPDFILISNKLMIGLIIQIVFLIFMIVISIFKPKFKNKKMGSI